MTNKFLLLAFAILCFASCEKEAGSDISGFDLGAPFTLDFAQTDNTINNEVEVNFFEVVSDSRCPSDVTCVWEGESSVKLNVKIGEQDVNLVLSTHANNGQGPPKDTLGEFIFTLLDVTPYPVSTVTLTDDDYQISLQVDEL